VGGERLSKTIRVEHGRPVIIVSPTSVLVLEFAKEPSSVANVPHAEKDILHCQARYRFRLLDGHSGSVMKGEGVLEELYKIVSQTNESRQLEDVGCKTRLVAGEYNLGWSQGTAGARSWLYYRTDSEIRFVQQPEALTFEAIGSEQMKRFLSSRNVWEFVAAGKTVQVVGPAVFSGELPTDQATSARITSGAIREGVFELRLSGLRSNANYVIESSYEPGAGGWTTVHSFLAKQPEQTWSDPLSQSVNTVFYRIREAKY